MLLNDTLQNMLCLLQQYAALISWRKDVIFYRVLVTVQQDYGIVGNLVA